MTPRRLRWGLTFVIVGAVLLLINMGRLPHPYESELVQLLPYILIGVGIEKIFTATRLEFIAYLSVLATAGVVAYSLFQGMPDFLDRGTAVDSPIVVPADSAVHKIDAQIKMSSADLSVRSTTGELFRTEKPDYWGYPDFDHRVNGDELVIDLNTNHRVSPGVRIQFDDNESADWGLAFAENCATSMTLDLEDVNARFNVADLPLAKLDIQGNSCDLYVKVGDKQAESMIDIFGESNRVRLRLPSHAGVRIKGYEDDSYFESIGLHRSGGAYINDAYDSASSKVDIALDESLSSLNIEFY